MEQRICRVCGDVVTPKKGMWPERCDPCRRKRDFLPGSKTYQLVCSVCDAGFVGGHVHAMYCSRACCKKAQRQRPALLATCPQCDRSYEAKTSRCVFCSRRCAQASRRPKQRRPCKRCGATLKGGRSYCDDCLRVNARWRSAQRKASRSMNLRTQKPWTCGPCAVCGSSFVSTSPTVVVCSDKCRRRRSGRSRRAKYGPETNRKRARLNGCFYEVVNRRKVFERDGYRCGICGGQTDPTVKVPHHNAPTLDHIIPMALGGAHAYRNVQCAHFDCNWDKGDDLPTLDELIAV